MVGNNFLDVAYLTFQEIADDQGDACLESIANLSKAWFHRHYYCFTIYLVEVERSLSLSNASNRSRLEKLPSRMYIPDIVSSPWHLLPNPTPTYQDLLQANRTQTSPPYPHRIIQCLETPKQVLPWVHSSRKSSSSHNNCWSRHYKLLQDQRPLHPWQSNTPFQYLIIRYPWWKSSI